MHLTSKTQTNKTGSPEIGKPVLFIPPVTFKRKLLPDTMADHPVVALREQIADCVSPLSILRGISLALNYLHNIEKTTE